MCGRTLSRVTLFAPNLSGVAFNDRDELAVSPESNNEVCGIDFKMNPERNDYFKSNNFMGPTLFGASTMARVVQVKPYGADWPQPGYMHDWEAHPCPAPLVQADGSCADVPEGSHLDMLHESPLSMGIAYMGGNSNQFVVLDGCGSRNEPGTATGPGAAGAAPKHNTCVGDGHVVYYDFNTDHGHGNGFHGDGMVRRYPDVRFTRVAGVASGIAVHDDGVVYYSDTGSGQVRAFRPATGTKHLLIRSWTPIPGEPTGGETGTGVAQWADLHKWGAGPPTENDAVVAEWINERKIDANIATTTRLGEEGGFNGALIKPQELLTEYAYVIGAEQRTLVADLERPSGLAVHGDVLYVADNATGKVHCIDRETGARRWAIETNAASLQGLAVNEAEMSTGRYEHSLVYTDAAANTVHAVRVARTTA